MNCPNCRKKIKWKDLLGGEAKKTSRIIWIAWPRVYCCYCSAELRSSTLSLIIGGLVFAISILLIVFGFIFSDHPGAKWIRSAGFLSLAIFVFWLHQFHGFVVKSPPDE